MERVGLGSVVSEVLGVHLAKEHSAVNWSTRPLPDPWLAYASLDVEHLVDLRERLAERLADTGKTSIAEAEFEATRNKPEKPSSPHPWRKLSGLHSLRQPRQLAVARSLWLSRDELARERDISPGRLIPDSAILAAASASPASASALMAVKGFNGRDAKASLARWWRAVSAGLHETDLPQMRVPSDTLPAPRLWKDKNPLGYARLTVARHALVALSEQRSIPVENLLAPNALRQAAWVELRPLSIESVSEALAKEGARPWQIHETAAIILDAFTDADVKLEAILASGNHEG
jgi:ribonuclease D